VGHDHHERDTMTKHEARKLLDTRALSKLALEDRELLRLLMANPEHTVNELAQRIAVHPRTAYRRLEMLQGLGLLTRKGETWRVDLSPMKAWPTLKEHAEQQAEKLREYDRLNHARWRARKLEQENGQ
jgi:hypothetical protein